MCASKDLGADGGYLQYRAGRPGESPELEFPGERVHPKGSFQFDLGASFATLSFTNGDYHYEIVESVQGGTTISVTRKGREPIVAVTCEAPSETLTLTSTIQRFEAIGLDR